MAAATVYEPPDPPSALAGLVGLSTASSVSAQKDASLLPRLELVVLPLAAALGLLLLFVAVVPKHRLAGFSGGVALRRGEIAVVIVVILNSVAIGILIAQLGR